MGQAHVRALAAAGARVAITDIDDEGGEKLSAELDEATAFWHHDVSDEASWSSVVGSVVERFGGLHILVNNAGILSSARLLDTATTQYLKIIETNQHSVFFGIRTVAPVMAANGGGSIVNIASIAALNGSIGTFPYAAAKWAVRGMTKVAALELADDNIRVNAVFPGTVDTDMVRALVPGSASGSLDRLAANVPLGQRLARAEEVAEVVLFLASDRSAFCTGAEFVIDGGKSAKLVQ
jgi:3alpha(or 20beta)-hydroxysteroid dehydrogenase